MVIEILFQEVCGLFGDSQNASYLQACLPDAEFVFTKLTDEPYFVNNDPAMIYIGCMSESTQMRVIDKLLPYADRINQLIDAGTVILATGNSGEVFCKSINYITLEKEVSGLGIFDLTAKTDLFKRYNGAFLGNLGDLKVTGFKSQFSHLYGDNTDCAFLKCQCGTGINLKSKLEGMRKNNLICTQLLGPILPLNPLFAEYLMYLIGVNAPAAYKEEAMNAYERRLKEFAETK